MFWLWSYVEKTDGGNFSIEFIDNYEILCNDCHRRKHIFLNQNLVLGFKYQYSVKIRWKQPDHLNSINYTIYFSKDSWGIETPVGKWIWDRKIHNHNNAVERSSFCAICRGAGGEYSGQVVKRGLKSSP